MRWEDINVHRQFRRRNRYVRFFLLTPALFPLILRFALTFSLIERSRSSGDLVSILVVDGLVLLLSALFVRQCWIVSDVFHDLLDCSRHSSSIHSSTCAFDRLLPPMPLPVRSRSLYPKDFASMAGSASLSTMRNHTRLLFAPRI